MSETRDCECPHSLPFCCCAIGYTGESLAYHSRIASSIIGWPCTAYDEDALAEHNAKMAAAREQRAAIDAMNVPAPAMLSRADKLRIPLGVKLGSSECLPCQEKAALPSNGLA